MAQDEIVRRLADPALYPHRPAAVEHVQTHISHVFLAGPYVYKLKKDVRFPFLDFGSHERRRHFCEEEVRLNRRLCPAVYLDVLPLTRAADGRIVLGGGGVPLEHVVWMRRLPAEGMLVERLRRDTVGPEMLEALAHTMAAFHAAVPAGPAVAAHADPEALRARWEENLRTAAPFVPHVLPPEEHEILADFGPTFIRRHDTILRARQRAGRVREGHGDLHAEHVCFVDAAVPAGPDLPPLAPGIYVFDCIEFSEALRCNDVASEIAFLAMDLEALERPDLAARFVVAYVAASGDHAVDVLLPFYAAYRACVRGKVESLKSGETEVAPAERAAAAASARRHFGLAARYAWRAGGPAVIACCGLSGTGKTTLAHAIAAATGFVPLSSDVVRRQRAGGAAEPVGPAAYGSGRYTPAARRATYEALGAAAERALAAGHGVVADATFVRRADRRQLAMIARRHRRPCLFVECRAEEAVVRARLAARADAPALSDARWDTHVGQRAEREPFGDDEPHVVVDTNGDADAVRARALRRLWRWRQGRPI